MNNSNYNNNKKSASDNSPAVILCRPTYQEQLTRAIDRKVT